MHGGVAVEGQILAHRGRLGGSRGWTVALGTHVSRRRYVSRILGQRSSIANTIVYEYLLKLIIKVVGGSKNKWQKLSKGNQQLTVVRNVFFLAVYFIIILEWTV